MTDYTIRDRAPDELTFNFNDAGTVGKLFVKDGRLHFEGNVDVSALTFFECVCGIFNRQADPLARDQEIDRAISYLTRNILEPHNAVPLDDLMGICTQVDHITATARNKALEDAAEIAQSFTGQLQTAGWQVPEVIAEQIRALKEG